LPDHPAQDSSPPFAAPRFAVVGGGISGLAAAYRLSKLMPEARITLLEGADRLGGVLETHHHDGVLIERGADSFITRLPGGVELCRELGMEDQLLSTSDKNRRALVVRSGRLHPIPEGFVIMSPERLTPLIFSPILSPMGKLRVLTEPLRGRPNRVNDPDFDESVASFSRRRLGREAFERLVQPLLAGIYTADPEKLSLAATMPQFMKSEREHGSLLRAVWNSRKQRGGGPSRLSRGESGARYSAFVTPREGLSSIIGRLAENLPDGTVRLGCQVASIDRQSDGKWELQTELGEALGPWDGILLATPAPRTASLVAKADGKLAELLGKIEYAGASVVSLVYSREQISNPLDSFGFVVPQIEGRRIVAASFPSVKFPGRNPAHLVVIRVFLGGAIQPELLALEDEQLLAVATVELGELLGIRGQPQIVDIARWDARMPQYHVGHLQLIDSIDRLVSEHSGLELAGNAYRGVGVPQCIQSGEAAAERLARKAKEAGET
jgi:protoporphyrinogen/coproporphyrinogen III oxidase